MEDLQSTLSAMSPQPADEDLEMYNPPPHRRPIGFLHLPYELRQMIYHEFIPRNYYIELVNGSLRWAKDRQWARIGYPVYNIRRVSKLVSEECLDILYGDNTFVTSYEVGGNPFLSVITEKNRGRIKSEQWHMICDTDLADWDDSRIYNCEIHITSWRGSMNVYMHVYDYTADDERPISVRFWYQEFIPGLRAILWMMVPQSTMTKVFMETDPVFVDWMMDDVKEIFDVYLTKGYEVWRL
jgi:hypothetical protein